MADRVWARFMETIDDEPSWNLWETYAVVRLPISGEVLIYLCTAQGSTNCAHNKEHMLIEKLQEDLDSSTGLYYVNVYRTSYTACCQCVERLDKFLQEKKQRNCVLILNYKITSVNGKDHRRWLEESREFWKCGISDLNTPSLVLQSFDSIKDLLEVHTLIKSFETDLDVNMESMKNVISKQPGTRKRIQLHLRKFNRSEVFKAFHDSYLHGCEAQHQVFCVLRFPGSGAARVFANDDLTKRHAESLMIAELEQPDWPINGVMIVYQNFSVCRKCILDKETGLHEFMTKHPSLRMILKAVGPYQITRQSCVENPATCNVGQHRAMYSNYTETASTLTGLKQSRVDLQSFQSYEDWRELINLLNESDDCYSDRVEFSEDKYKYTRSRRDEDECANQDFSAILG